MVDALREAVLATLPLALFLTAALSISADAERHGLGGVAARRLARWGSGDARRLYGLVCFATLVLTAAVSLDGAVILLVPVVNTLHRQYHVPLRPLFLGCVVVANASSLALPQGNPTNLVVIQGLGVDPVSFTRHTAVPALVATAVVALAVAVFDRRALRCRYAAPERPDVTAVPRAPVLVVVAATVGNVAALALGAPPWAPICAAAALLWAWRALRGAGGGFLRAPVRISLQVLVLVAATDLAITRLGATAAHLGAPALVPMVAVAAVAAGIAALVTNLPPSVALGQLPVHWPVAYAALAGLSVGALVAPRGSVATLIAFDLADEAAVGPIRRRFARAIAPAAALATAAAVTLIWISLA
jgi:arsenical pump membrane protein